MKLLLFHCFIFGKVKIPSIQVLLEVSDTEPLMKNDCFSYDWGSSSKDWFPPVFMREWCAMNPKLIPQFWIHSRSTDFSDFLFSYLIDRVLHYFVTVSKFFSLCWLVPLSVTVVLPKLPIYFFRIRRFFFFHDLFIFSHPPIRH